MIEFLRERLGAVEVADARETSGLQVFGLRAAPNGALNYLTLDEALGAGLVEVAEISQEGSVPALQVRNHSDAMVFLMAGEHLVGAKQDRVINASLLIAGRSELTIPVSCVEAGRWHARSRRFSSPGTMSHGGLRKMMSEQTSQGYRLSGTPESHQGEVWREVSRKLGALGSSSPSQAYYQVYEDHRRRLDDLLGRLPVPEGACGAAFALAGRVAGADLFDQPATLAKLWPKLVGAYALDALELESSSQAGSTTAAATAAMVNQWLAAVAGAKVEPFKSPGLGYDLRLEAATLVGAGLVVEDRPVHVELFARDEPANA
jgi:hypothetical protein